MAKRGYKLQEFLAHSGNVNCLNIGKKARRLFITGGDDHKVNVWAIGKPESLMCLSGHTSPVESVAFDSAEVLVLAGTSSGVIKQWDLEEAKMVRTLSGHRSNCTALEFHPFGEFFASGSLDTNLRIWDIRKKGCIHTYNGHTQGISTIKFSPDGRWVVSGGFDNVVKVWDLTAGKLLHDFTFHEGHIRSLDFHPLEFLLATGSADRTVKFWDLETFELIGSTRPEATGVRAITFHPDGRTLFSGLEESLKVYSWEPVICHDAVDMGWSTLGDLCIHEGKLLGCSYYQNSVGVWVADISLIEPYGDASQNDRTEQKFNLKQQGSAERVGTILMNSNMRCRSPDYDSKEIKNIYVDSSGGKPVSQKVESLTPPKVPSHLDTKEINDQVTKKLSRVFETPPKPNDHAVNKLFLAPSIVPRDSPDGKDSSNSTSESITFSRTKRGMLLRPAHARKPSNTKHEMAAESGNFVNILNTLDSPADSNSEIKTVSEDTKGEHCEKMNPSVNSVTERQEKVLSPRTPNSQETSNKSLDGGKESSSIKVVNGVAVVRGRTRSLVERFEKRDQLDANEDQATVAPSHANPDVDKTPTVDKTPAIISSRVVPEVDKISATISSRVNPKISKTSTSTVVSSRVIQEVDKTPPIISPEPFITPSHVVPEVDKTATIISSRVNLEMNKTGNVISSHVITAVDKAPAIVSPEPTIISSRAVPEVDKTSTIISSRVNPEIKKTRTVASSHVIPEVDKTPTVKSPEVYKTPSVTSSRLIPEVDKRRSVVSSRVIREVDKKPTVISGHVIPEVDTTPTVQNEEPQVSTSDLTSVNDCDFIEDLMQTHDVLLSNLRSRLTKLQVVRHFWERGDIKGAIGAMKKLPDHSVQADVISVLMEKMGILNLDLFSLLLPVLLGLLNSKIDRHATLSMEMLLKLVAVFGPVIRSTVTARRGVGVDLHAEQRKECCNQCSLHLQHIKKILPLLARRGGLVAKSALELNLVLQES